MKGADNFFCTDDAGQFDREWKEKTRGFYGGRNRISGTV